MVAAMSLIYLAVVTAVFRAIPLNRRAAMMVRLWAASLFGFVGLYLSTPSDLWILPSSLGAVPTLSGLLFGVLVYTAAFFGGTLQLYNLAERGFSLRILIDIDETPGGAMTPTDILHNYSRCRGLSWMYQKRLDGLLEQGMIALDDGRIRNTARGQRTAIVAERLRSFMRFGAWT
jgi:hypothetical protein